MGLSKKKFVWWLSLSSEGAKQPPYIVQMVITSLRSVRKRATSSMTAVDELIRQPHTKRDFYFFPRFVSPN